MHSGTTGIGKQVQETLVLGHLTQHAAGQTVIQEQSGIQIILQVHQQTRAIFVDLQHLPLFGQLLVLLLPFLPLTDLEYYVGPGNTGHRDGGLHHVQQPLPRHRLGNGFRSGIFLDHQMIAITVDGRIIIRQVGVIEPVGIQPLLLGPFVERLDILAQTIGKIFGHHLGGGDGVFGNLVVTELTLECTIEQAILFFGPQTQTTEQIGRGAQHRDPPALKSLPQRLPQLLIQLEQLWEIAETFAIRGVGHHDATDTRPRVLQLSDILFHKLDQLGKTGRLGVLPRTSENPEIAIVPEELQVASLVHAALGSHPCLCQQRLPQGLIMQLEFGQAKARSQQSRRHVSSHHGRLDQQGSGATHGIQQRLTLPAGPQQHGGGQIFFEWCLAGSGSITALMQSRPRQIECHASLFTFEVNLDADIRLSLIDVRPHAAALGEAIDDGILDFQGTILGITDRGRSAGEVHSQRLMRRKIVLPRDVTDPKVEIHVVSNTETGQREQHARGQTTP